MHHVDIEFSMVFVFYCMHKLYVLQLHMHTYLCVAINTAAYGCYSPHGRYPITKLINMAQVFTEESARYDSQLSISTVKAHCMYVLVDVLMMFVIQP